jgi:hypothetical protein
MDSLVIRLGVVGSSAGNGHPFSFPAIINGFDSESLIGAGWSGIASYLGLHSDGEGCIPSASVTHVWTPNAIESREICESTFVNSIVDRPESMIGNVDAVMILRDDWRSHWELSQPFLTAGVPVFVDKPLTLSSKQLTNYLPHIDAGRLMSCSGLRYARQLDAIRAGLIEAGEVAISIEASVPKDMSRYGIHIIEMISSIGRLEEINVKAISKTDTGGVRYEYSNRWHDRIVVLCLGESIEPIRMRVVVGANTFTITFTDHFDSFRATIEEFLNMEKTKVPPIPSKVVQDVIQAVILTNESWK